MRIYRDALEMRQRTLGQTHPETAITLDHLSWLHRVTGDFASAERLARESLKLRLAAFADKRSETGTSRLHLAAALYLAGNAQEALSEADRALTIYRGTLPDRNWRVGLAHLVRGVARVALGDADGEREARSGHDVVQAAWVGDSAPRREAAGLLAMARRPRNTKRSSGGLRVP